MAADTARYSLPYQQDSDAPDGPALGQDLAEATEAALGGVDDRVAVIELTAAKSRGLIKRGNRPTNTATAGSTVEIGVLRVDSIAFKANHAYAVRAPRLRFSSTVTTDHVKFHFRINTSGTATTSSTIMGRAETDHVASTSLEVFRFVGGSDETASILLSMVRTSAGAGVCTIQGVDEGGIDIIIEDIGDVVADSGTDI